MAAIDFPSNPENGQTQTNNDVTWTWNNANSTWDLQGGSGGGGGTPGDGSITTAKLAADAVTNAKLADDAVETDNIKDANVTTAKLANDAVTKAKLGTDVFANETVTKAGTVEDEAVNPKELHAVLDDLIHVAQFSGFTNTTSTGASMPLGSWNVNATGTVAHYRAHTAAEHTAMFAEFERDKRCIMRQTDGDHIEQTFAAVPTEHDIDGQSVGYIQCTIGSHLSRPANPTLTGDWIISVMPAQNRTVFNNAPAESIPLLALATIPAGRMQGLSAAGNSDIGLNRFGDVSDSVWNTITASNSNLLPIPHPNQSTTPSGTGEVTFTPKSAASTFLCLANVGFGWLGDHSAKVHFLVARKIGTGAWTVIESSKKFNVLNGNYGSVDINVTPFFVDAPNTTSDVSYRWMIVRGDVSGGGNNGRVYPIAQSTAFLEVTNL